jgi:hypothetical protein
MLTYADVLKAVAERETNRPGWLWGDSAAERPADTGRTPPCGPDTELVRNFRELAESATVFGRR